MSLKMLKIVNPWNFSGPMGKIDEEVKYKQLMNTDVHSINTSRGYQGQRNQRQTPNTGAGKPQACRNCGWGPHSR